MKGLKKKERLAGDRLLVFRDEVTRLLQERGDTGATEIVGRRILVKMNDCTYEAFADRGAVKLRPLWQGRW